MTKDQDKKTPAEDKPADQPAANAVPTDAEIEAAAERLGADWLRRSAPHHAVEGGHVVQHLARGRAHPVTVEVKRPRRKLPKPD